jgi:hypothetical protein
MSRARDNANLSPTIPDARMPNLTGDITTVEGAVATTIADDAVTAAKLANSINTDIATGVTANTTANAALPTTTAASTYAPKASPAFTGAPTITSAANEVKLTMTAGSLISIANGSTSALIPVPGTGGLVGVQKSSGGSGGYTGALFTTHYSSAGNTILVAQGHAGVFSSTAGTAGKANVYISGYTNSIYIQNNIAATVGFAVQMIGFSGQ